MSPNTTLSPPLKLQMARCLGVGIFQFVLDVLLLGWDALFAGRWSPGLGKFLEEAARAVLGFFIPKLWIYRHAQR